MSFKDMYREHVGIPADRARDLMLELVRPTGPPDEPVKTAAVQAGLLKIAAIEVAQPGEPAQDAVAQQSLTDPNVQQALDYQQVQAEREHFAAVAQEAEERAATAEQQAQMSGQQAQEAQMATDEATQQAQMEAQEKQQAMQEAISVRDQSLQEQMAASRKREELVGEADNLKAQLDQLAASTQEQTEALRQGVDMHQQNVAVNPIQEQQEAQMQEQAMQEQAQAQANSGAPKEVQEEQQQADQAAQEADQQAQQAQQAEAQAQQPQQAPPPPPEIAQQGAGGPASGAPPGSPQIPGAASLPGTGMPKASSGDMLEYFAKHPKEREAYNARQKAKEKKASAIDEFLELKNGNGATALMTAIKKHAYNEKNGAAPLNVEALAKLLSRSTTRKGVKSAAITKESSALKALKGFAKEHPIQTGLLAAAPVAAGAGPIAYGMAQLGPRAFMKSLKMNPKRHEISSAIDMYKSDGKDPKNMSSSDLNKYVQKVRSGPKAKTAAGGSEKKGVANHKSNKEVGSNIDKALTSLISKHHREGGLASAILGTQKEKQVEEDRKSEEGVKTKEAMSPLAKGLIAGGSLLTAGGGAAGLGLRHRRREGERLAIERQSKRLSSESGKYGDKPHIARHLQGASRMLEQESKKRYGGRAGKPGSWLAPKKLPYIGTSIKPSVDIKFGEDALRDRIKHSKSSRMIPMGEEKKASVLSHTLSGAGGAILGGGGAGLATGGNPAAMAAGALGGAAVGVGGGKGLSALKAHRGAAASKIMGKAQSRAAASKARSVSRIAKEDAAIATKQKAQAAAKEEARRKATAKSVREEVSRPSGPGISDAEAAAFKKSVTAKKQQAAEASRQAASQRGAEAATQAQLAKRLDTAAATPANLRERLSQAVGRTGQRMQQAFAASPPSIARM